MELSEKILLSDVKLGVKQKIDTNNVSTDSFSLLMHSFANNGPDYEGEEFAKTVYNVLDWNGNYFDVINSFWTSFSYVMHCAYPDDYKIAQAGNVKIYKNHYCDPAGKYEIQSFPEKFLSKNNNTKIKKQVQELTHIYEINTFAAMCHCVANFMPCPDEQFNSAKGVVDNIKDYFPLMIDKIQKCIDDNKPLQSNGKTIELETLKSWKEWFILNREKYSLESYYDILQTEGNVKIYGIPLFKNQSLEYPCPITKDEVEECLKEIIKRIQYRAKLIEIQYKKQYITKELSDEN